MASQTVPELRHRSQAADANGHGGGNCSDEGNREPTENYPPGHPKATRSLHVGRGARAGETCRRISLSPQFKLFTLAIVAIVPLFGTVGFMPMVMLSLDIEGVMMQLPFYLVAIWISVQFLYNFAMSQFTDPGSPVHIKPTYEAIGQFEMVFADEPGRPRVTQVDSDLPLLYAPNWCDHCAHWKPPRTHHCSFCKRCTLRMDHHCPFSGNCIGARNHGHFVIMYIFAFLGLFYSLALCAAAIYTFPTSKAKTSAAYAIGDLLGVKQSPATKWMTGITGFIASFALQIFIRTNLQIALQTIFTGVALAAVLSFGIPALCFAATNVTMLEHNFPMKEYVQVKSQVYCPLGPGFYNKGIHANMVELLGRKWLLRLLLPTKGSGPDMQAAIAPRPSSAGCSALVARVKQVAEEGVQQQVKSCEQLGINPGPEAKTSGHVV
mmetsp:Transcript_83217/g.239232  ORF Transcript_83217/g.239232 Transcript_83217/m.239232 type:complete len:436 (-) Transcript_83217:59-1366(-)